MHTQAKWFLFVWWKRNTNCLFPFFPFASNTNKSIWVCFHYHRFCFHYMPDGPDVNSGINEKKNGTTLFDRKEIPVGMKCCIFVFTKLFILSWLSVTGQENWKPNSKFRLEWTVLLKRTTPRDGPLFRKISPGPKQSMHLNFHPNFGMMESNLLAG